MLLRTTAVKRRRSIDVSLAPSPELARSETSRPDYAVIEDFTLGKIPDPENQIKSSQLSKLSQGQWLPRFVALTKDQLIIGIPGRDTVSDRIPLVMMLMFEEIKMIISTIYRTLL
jgi:hypothetical protein